MCIISYVAVNLGTITFFSFIFPLAFWKKGKRKRGKKREKVIVPHSALGSINTTSWWRGNANDYISTGKDLIWQRIQLAKISNP
jgi:hypothetical protein